MRRLLTGVQQMMARHPTASVILCIAVINVLSHFVGKLSFAWPSVVGPPPAPHRFFPRSSVVVDFPYGDLAGVTSLIEKDDEEWLFAMYYAPWCGRSMAARPEIDKAARYLEDEVRFIAVNCWYENGSCRQNNKFPHFPALYMHHMTMNGVKYNGVISAEYIVQFIHMILNPLTRLSTRADLLNLISSADTTVIGYFDFAVTSTAAEYKQFYYAAIRTIERDPRNVIYYGVVTDLQLAKSVGLNASSTVIMIRSPNDSIKYPRHMNFTSSALVHWTFNYRHHSSVKWLLSSGSKSLSLSTELRRGPALVAFIDARPLSFVNPHLSLLREIASVYNNCNGTLIVGDSVARSRLAARQRTLLRKCTTIDKIAADKSHRTSRKALPPDRHCCLSVGQCDACVHYLLEHPRSVRACDFIQVSNVEFVGTPSPLDVEGCMESANNYNTAEFVSRCCSSDKNTSLLNQTFMAQFIDPHRLLERRSTATPVDVLHRFSSDPFVASEALANFCRRSRRLKNTELRRTLADLGLDSEDFKYDMDLAGLGCRTNRSVRFYVVDRRLVSGTALEEVLIGSYPQPFDGTENITSSGVDRPTVVIVDVADPSVYVMTGKFSHRNLASFVMNFTTGSLSPFHRSTSDPPELPTDTTGSDDSLSRDGPVHVVEVTGNSFNDIVMDPNKDVLLFYYASWCGFCSNFAHVYLTLAHHFRAVRSIVFARINGDSNDLPWPFYVDRYPTLIYFPARHKAESVVFPPHLELTLPNLLRFIYHSAGPTSEIDSCSRSCILSNVRQTSSAILRLGRRRNRLRSAIEKLRFELGSMFNITQQFQQHSFTDQTPTNTVGPPQSFPPPVTTDPSADIAVDGIVPGKNFVVTADFDLAHAGSDRVESDKTVEIPESADASDPNLSVPFFYSNANRDSSKVVQATCSIESILRTRNELAFLRRHLYRTEEQLSMLRRVFSHILLPAVSRRTVFLERRQWIRIRMLRLLAAARFRNFYDLVSGCEFGLHLLN